MNALRRMGVSVRPDALAFSVPGRIEVLGKHTDYAGGSSILAASEQSVVIVAVPRNDSELHIHSVQSGESLQISISPSLEAAAGWANYPVTTIRRLASNFPDARIGADIAFLSSIPIAAGMSSSSALVVALFLAVSAVNGLHDSEAWQAELNTPELLAGYLAAMENGLSFGTLRGEARVGTMGGSEDHTAMLCAREGELVQYRFVPVRFQESVAMPHDHCFVVASSGVAAEKAGAALQRYNRAAGLMQAAAELWRQEAGRDDRTIGAALDADPSAAERILNVLSASTHARFSQDDILSRVRQFIAEDREIIPVAFSALREGNLKRFGSTVDRSQQLAEELLGNQIAETEFLAREAREAGAVAASAFGAGFGGSVWAMVHTRMAESFLERWKSAYLRRFPEHLANARFMQTMAGERAGRLSLDNHSNSLVT